MKTKLSRKITFFFLLILLVVVCTMIFFSYYFFKDFYKEQLSFEVNGDLRAYTMMIEEGIDENIVTYLLLEKNRERHVNMIFFDGNIEPMYSSHDISRDWLKEYQSWIGKQKDSNGETLQYIDTGIDYHIPHIWAFQPVLKEGQLLGYFFIDKDTGEFEKAKQQLIILLFSMGLFTLVIGIFLTHYITKVISKPLIKIGATTREIAKGDFDIKLSIASDDEVGQLAGDIRDMTKQLKEFRDSKRQFISHVSHDLRTPITYIKGYSAVMRDMSVIEDKELRRNLDVIYNEAKRMEYLVSDLFQLTKLEEGKIILQKEEINVIPWLESIVASRQLMLDNMSITCKVVADDSTVMVSIDQQRLGQAVINIIENSIRYTPKGGHIFINAFKKEAGVTIEIQDNGIGISKGDLPHIWERFYRTDKSRARESGGSGLGLAIVKEIVEVHGGSVDVKSTEGKGTSFYLDIPKLPKFN